VAFRPDSFGLWYYKVSKMWSVIILGPKIFGLWWSVVFRQTDSELERIWRHFSPLTSPLPLTRFSSNSTRCDPISAGAIVGAYEPQ